MIWKKKFFFIIASYLLDLVLWPSQSATRSTSVGIIPALKVRITNDWRYSWSVDNMKSVGLTFSSIPKRFWRKSTITWGLKKMQKVTKKTMLINHVSKKFFFLYIFCHIMSLWEGASFTYQDRTWDFILSSGERFSIIIPLKWDVKMHLLT